MSSSKSNTTYKKTSFLAGNNTEFINQFYADFLSDPKSLPKSWRLFFEGLSDEQKLVYNDLKGPSWSPEKKSKKIYLQENNTDTDKSIASEVDSSTIKQATQESAALDAQWNNLTAEDCPPSTGKLDSYYTTTYILQLRTIHKYYY